MRHVAVLIAFLSAPLIAPTSSPAVTLNFEGLSDLEPVAEFYNGGLSGDHGISFSPNMFALIDSDQGGSGLFANEPSADTVLTYSGASAVINVPVGFTSVEFYFAGSTTPNHLVEEYSGLDGTGQLLSQSGLASGGYSSSGDPTGQEYGVWLYHQDLTDTVARSVVFSGDGQLLLDDFEIVLVPEPSTALFVGLGLVALAGCRRG